jgi:hypothetical protein
VFCVWKWPLPAPPIGPGDFLTGESCDLSRGCNQVSRKTRLQLKRGSQDPLDALELELELELKRDLQRVLRALRVMRESGLRCKRVSRKTSQGMAHAAWMVGGHAGW